MRTVATIDQIQCTVEITACVIQNALWQWHTLRVLALKSSRRYILKDLSAMIQNWKKQEQGQEVTFDFPCCAPH